ncbi:unnamed protein product, partial [Prorocentrum cordatum]
GRMAHGPPAAGGLPLGGAVPGSAPPVRQGAPLGSPAPAGRAQLRAGAGGEDARGVLRPPPAARLWRPGARLPGALPWPGAARPPRGPSTRVWRRARCCQGRLAGSR